MPSDDQTATPPGPGEPGYDKMAVPRYAMELLRDGKPRDRIVDLVKERYPYTRINERHVAWMASARTLGDLDVEVVEKTE